MYSKLPNLVIGFHGCDEEVYNSVIREKIPLTASNNKYDWLGNGIYFWEQNYDRALEWAKVSRKRPKVIGAVIDLGNCLNLMDSRYYPIIKQGYEMLENDYKTLGKAMPTNHPHGTNDHDRILRDLDCAVIQRIHVYNKQNNIAIFDSVRAPFIEGNEVYPGSGFKEKSHIQICIVNPNCIKGYFDPLEKDAKFEMP